MTWIDAVRWHFEDYDTPYVVSSTALNEWYSHERFKTHSMKIKVQVIASVNGWKVSFNKYDYATFTKVSK